jgi:hypothetical protein
MPLRRKEGLVLKNEVTAKSLTVHPEGFDTYRYFLKSPFSGKLVYIASAVKRGANVELTTEDGLVLYVEGMRKLTKEKREKRRKKK